MIPLSHIHSPPLKLPSSYMAALSFSPSLAASLPAFSSFSSPAPSLGLVFCRPRSFPSISAAASGDLTSAVTTTSPREGETEGYFLSGEWPENFSILNYEDLCKHYEPFLFKEEAQPHSFLADVMSEIKYTATANQVLEEVDQYFLEVSGLPVVNHDYKCIGVLSKKDRARASKGLQSTVGEVMTSPAISLSADKTVNDAAILMLKNKIHRIPIVNEAHQVVGIVTRTDIFRALEGES